ncbi:LOW QUALITY PROTEIN: hypothetical protein YC2023_005889 [Brassica napus]
MNAVRCFEIRFGSVVEPYLVLDVDNQTAIWTIDIKVISGCVLVNQKRIQEGNRCVVWRCVRNDFKGDYDDMIFSRKMKIKVRRFEQGDYEKDLSKGASQLTTEVLFEAQLVFQGICVCLLASQRILRDLVDNRTWKTLQAAALFNRSVVFSVATRLATSKHLDIQVSYRLGSKVFRYGD